MLVTCPANAPSWEPEAPRPAGLAGEVAARASLGLRHDEPYIRGLHSRQDTGAGDWSEAWGFLMTVDEETSIWQRQGRLTRAANVAQGYLDRLPDDQAGSIRINLERGAVVAQVTRDADLVRAELQGQVGADAVVEMETVRFPHAELARIAKRIEGLRGLAWTSIGVSGGDARVEVMVPGDVDEARRLIEAVADPCSFAVTHGVATVALAPADPP
jgi:hypothetical protein